MIKNEVKLPKKLSDLIVVAIKDLKAVEKSKTYEVNMSQWHTAYERPKVGTPATKCSVCFAGSVMAKSMKLNPETQINDPDYFSAHNRQRLYALDTLRSGDVEKALDQIGDSMPDSLTFEHQVVPGYYGNPVGFKDKMLEIAKTLKQIGK